MLTDLSRIQEDDILFNGVGFVAVARLSVSGIDGRIFFAVTLCYFCEESVVVFLVGFGGTVLGSLFFV